jgi:hypothetical protein
MAVISAIFLVSFDKNNPVVLVSTPAKDTLQGAPIGVFSLRTIMSSNTDSATLNVCTRCISSKHFSEWIEANGEQGKCDFNASHGGSSKVIDIETLAVEIDRFFRENYQLGEEYPYWEGESDNPTYVQYGSPYDEILSNELESDREIVDAISKNLPDASPYDVMQGDSRFYDEALNYESKADAQKRLEWDERWYENRFDFRWYDFCWTVQYERRFFETKKLLDDLFGKPSEYDRGTVKPVNFLKSGTKVYRARLLDNILTRDLLDSNPAGELGAPPKEKTPPGRMNVEFIPAFYAAFCEETAVAEIRPGIGDQVAVGEFAVRKDLRVFDFTAFSRAQAQDLNEANKHTRYAFITQMQDEISKPISPFAKQREYIPTQIIAEYLREYFECDAVIYKSAMHEDDRADNRNIVFLNRGNPFVGDRPNCVLSYLRNEVMEIRNVVYTFGEWLPF